MGDKRSKIDNIIEINDFVVENENRNDSVTKNLPYKIDAIAFSPRNIVQNKKKS